MVKARQRMQVGGYAWVCGAMGSYALHVVVCPALPWCVWVCPDMSPMPCHAPVRGGVWGCGVLCLQCPYLLLQSALKIAGGPTTVRFLLDASKVNVIPEGIPGRWEWSHGG